MLPRTAGGAVHVPRTLRVLCSPRRSLKFVGFLRKELLTIFVSCCPHYMSHSHQLSFYVRYEPNDV